VAPTQVAGFLCPSDLDRLTNVEGHSNYCGNSGSTPDSSQVICKANGPFVAAAPFADYRSCRVFRMQSCEVGGLWDGERGAMTAGSRHPGMVNLLMYDGSVRGVKDSVAPAWWALGTIAGREVVSSDAY
jgi:prepilin-type processing-associated H-X9-DG protein